MAAQLLLAGLPCFRASDKERERERERKRETERQRERVQRPSNKEGAWQVLRENWLPKRNGGTDPLPFSV